MSIVKKILIITASILATGTNHPIKAHNSEIAYEIKQILNFADKLRLANSKQQQSARHTQQALTIAHWLELQVLELQAADNISHKENDKNIRTIAAIITNDSTNLESKIAALEQIITTQKNQKFKATNRIKTVKEVIKGTGQILAAMAIIPLVALITYIYPEIINGSPRKKQPALQLHPNNAQQIINFSQQILDNDPDNAIAQWLQTKVKNGFKVATNDEVDKIVYIIFNPYLTTDEKIRLLTALKISLEQAQLYATLKAIGKTAGIITAAGLGYLLYFNSKKAASTN